MSTQRNAIILPVLLAVAVVVTAVAAVAAAALFIVIWMQTYTLQSNPTLLKRILSQRKVQLSYQSSASVMNRSPDVYVFILSLGYHHPRRRGTLCYATVSTCGTEGANWIGITVCKPGLTSWWAPTNKLDWWRVNLKQFDERKGQIEFSTM